MDKEKVELVVDMKAVDMMVMDKADLLLAKAVVYKEMPLVELQLQDKAVVVEGFHRAVGMAGHFVLGKGNNGHLCLEALAGQGLLSGLDFLVGQHFQVGLVDHQAQVNQVFLVLLFHPERRCSSYDFKKRDNLMSYLGPL